MATRNDRTEIFFRRKKQRQLLKKIRSKKRDIYVYKNCIKKDK